MFWKPAVGTTVGGLITYGIDWDSDSPKTDRVAISAYTPNATHAVWADNSSRPLIIPPQRLMSRLWYTFDSTAKQDAQPGIVVWAVEGDKSKLMGEFWMRYKVKFSGTVAA